MAKKKEVHKGFGYLLDNWKKPDNAGVPVGCIATSFTFSSSFFEEECLSRFLGLETDPLEDGPLYLIDREEKLAQVTCACAVVDRHHCKGPRSLRWDLLPARVNKGILHAKISLLVWSDAIRILIGSANLTEDGYRRNLEVYSVFDYKKDGKHPIHILFEVVNFLNVCLNTTRVKDMASSPALDRARELLDRVQKTPEDWGIPDSQCQKDGIGAYPIFVQPGKDHALEQLSRLWPASTPPTDAYVVSPFFNPPEAVNLPAKDLWQRLRQRGAATVSFYLNADTVSDKEVHVHAPESLLKAQPTGRPAIETQFYQVDLENARPLHAKGISFEEKRWMVYMTGSSNFTSAGLGFGTQNLEANIAYVVDAKKQPKTADAFDAAFPDGTELDPKTIHWQRIAENEDEAPEEESALPAAFYSATYVAGEKGDAHILFEFSEILEDDWKVVDENDEKVILNWEKCVSSGNPLTICVAWTATRPPSGFWVYWENNLRRSWWPVNVESLQSLPPPEELKSLSLELLIEILTSARPLHEVLRGHLKHKKSTGALPTPDILIDPHKKVDTSRFLLQRTRKISWALSSLRVRLERPVVTEEALHWRFYGPVGVQAFIDALLKECHGREEKTFLLSELALELDRVNPRTGPGCLPEKRIKAVIKELMITLQNSVYSEMGDSAVNLKKYIDTVFDRVNK